MRDLRILKTITVRDIPSLGKYLTEIGKVKLITAQEEVELARRIKKGDNDALEALCKANLRFVVSVAKQYQGQGLPLPDLIGEGNIGLIKAAQRFDETRGFKFISYGVWWIRQQILQGLAEQGRIVRLPLNKVGSIGRINKAFAKLEQEHERPPTAEELAEVLEMTLEEVRVSLNNTSRHLSMDAPLRSDGEGDQTLLDVQESPVPGPEEIVENMDFNTEVARVLHILSAREADILRLYFGLQGNQSHTLDEIGRKFELTRERVRQIKEKAIRRLRHDKRCIALRTYFN